MSGYNAFLNSIVAPIFRRRIKNINGTIGLPLENPCIFAINHTVLFDHVIFTSYIKSLLTKKIYFPTKYTYYDFYKQLRYADNLGMVRVDPEAPSKCLTILLEKIKQGHCIGIFPEGVGHGSKELKRGKSGVARLALMSRTTVVPVGINGHEYGKRFNNWMRILMDHRRNITIRIGKPLKLNKYYDKPITYEILREVTDRIMNEIGKLCGKKYKNYKL